MKSIHNPSEEPDFSVVLGGPLFQLLMRLRLTTPALELLKKRIIVITLFAWLPLLVLSLLDGKAWGEARVPFLYDLETQARFLIALPLLIAAELMVHRRLRTIVGEFIERDIITESVFPRFKELIVSAMKLRNSVTVEVVLIILTFGVGQYLWDMVSVMEEVTSGVGTWYGTTSGTGSHLTLAGYWYVFVSRPLFQFILCRWYFRLFVWARFLWQTSRLPLNLIPTHPDHAAGIGFLGMSSAAFIPLIAAHGVLMAGLIANSIFFAGEKLTDSTTLIVSVVLFLLLVIAGPMCAFSPSLMRTKREGEREYGVLASRYVSDFDLKWVRGGAGDEKELLGSSDIQSLADLDHSFQVVSDIKSFPFGMDTIIQILVFSLLPVMPLLLTMIPLNVLIRKFVEAIFMR